MTELGPTNLENLAGLIGTTIDGKYRIEALLGSGGMGAVYKAHHLVFDKSVAVKVLHAHSDNAYDALQRFKREAALLERLTNPNIVQFYAFDVCDGRAFAVLEYLQGRALNEVLAEQGPFSFESCAAIFVPILSAASAAHEHGIVHRDLKPSNVMLLDAPHTVAPQIKILDFGLAKLIQESGNGQRVTQTGALLGTPLYMSPEQCLGKSATAASDIYAIGCMLFECISGHPPFSGDSSYAVLIQHLDSQPPQLTDAKGMPVPAAVEDIVLTALHKDPEKRYASAAEFLTAVRLLTSIDAITPAKRGKVRVKSVAPRSAPRNLRLKLAGAAMIIALGLSVSSTVRQALQVSSTDATSTAEQAVAMCDAHEYARMTELLKKALNESKNGQPDEKVFSSLKQCSKTLADRYQHNLVNCTKLRTGDELSEPPEIIPAIAWTTQKYVYFGRLRHDDPLEVAMAARLLAQSASIQPIEYGGYKIGGDPDTAERYLRQAYELSVNIRTASLPKDYWAYMGNVGNGLSHMYFEQSLGAKAEARKGLLDQSIQAGMLAVECYRRFQFKPNDDAATVYANTFESMANAKIHKGDSAGALADWKEAGRLYAFYGRNDLQDISARQAIILSLTLSKPEAAKEIWTERLSRKYQNPHPAPFDVVQWLFVEGWMLSYDKKFAQAESVLAKASSLSVRHKLQGTSDVCFKYADVLRHLKKWQEASVQAKKSARFADGTPVNRQFRRARAAALIELIDRKSQILMQ